jgi:tetratricopeptide (TPR) repeat protein
MRWMSVLVLVAVLASGCSHNKRQVGGVSSLSPEKAEALNAEHSKFEKSEDPPISAETYYAAGQLAESQDQPSTAITQYKSALKANPKHLPSMYQLGTLYTQLGMYVDGAGMWQQYVSATGGSAAAYGNLGFCYELARRPKEAEDAYKKGIAKNGSEQTCRVNYGLMLARQGRVEEAMVQLGAVLKPAEVHYNLGSVYEQQGKKESAKAEYQKALLIDVNLHDASKRLKGLK